MTTEAVFDPVRADLPQQAASHRARRFNIHNVPQPRQTKEFNVYLIMLT